MAPLRVVNYALRFAFLPRPDESRVPLVRIPAANRTPSYTPGVCYEIGIKSTFFSSNLGFFLLLFFLPSSLPPLWICRINKFFDKQLFSNYLFTFTNVTNYLFRQPVDANDFFRKLNVSFLSVGKLFFK